MKYKIHSAVTLLIAAIIICSAILSGIYRGRTYTVYDISESSYAISQKNDKSIAQIIRENGITDIILPNKYYTASNDAVYLNKITTKKYTETSILTCSGSVCVREYNYAYLIEDEPLKITSQYEKMNFNGIDIFILENTDGTLTAAYNIGCILYYITENISYTQVINFFSDMNIASGN